MVVYKGLKAINVGFWVLQAKMSNQPANYNLITFDKMTGCRIYGRAIYIRVVVM